MTWNPFPPKTSPDPRANDPTLHPAFRDGVLRAVRTSALRGYVVGHSVPWRGVDLPLVEKLPGSPEDRDEVNLLSGGNVYRYIYRSSTDSWESMRAASADSATLADAALISPVTALPSSPSDGETVRYKPSGAPNSPVWICTWDDALNGGSGAWSASGPPLFSEVTAEQSTTSTSYTDLATGGPAVSIPADGIYFVTIGAMVFPGSGAIGRMSWDNGSGASDSTALRLHVGAVQASVTRTTRPTLSSGSVTAKYKTTNNVSTAFADRHLLVTPVELRP